MSEPLERRSSRSPTRFIVNRKIAGLLSTRSLCGCARLDLPMSTAGIRPAALPFLAVFAPDSCCFAFLFVIPNTARNDNQKGKGNNQRHNSLKRLSLETTMSNPTQEIFDITAATYDADRAKLIPCYDAFYRRTTDLIV